MMSEVIELDLPDEVILQLAMLAHEDNVTLNQKINQIVMLRLLELEHKDNESLRETLLVERDLLAELQEKDDELQKLEYADAYADDLKEENRKLEVEVNALKAENQNLRRDLEMSRISNNPYI